MKPGIILAIFASTILIGGASWTRLGSSSKPSSLVKLDKNGEEIAYQNLFLDSLESATSTQQEPLNNTDLVSRQLLTDYIELATSGQANEDSINSLAEKYVDSLPTMSISNTISYGDIKTVPENLASVSYYSSQMTEAHEVYKKRITSLGVSPGSITGLSNSALNAASVIGKAYEEAATKLKNMDVPASFVLQHYQLVNSYLSSAAALEAVGNANTDSTKAFVGLIKLNENIEQEAVLLEEISQILVSKEI